MWKHELLCHTYFPGGDHLLNGRMPTEEETGVIRKYHLHYHTLYLIPCHPWKGNGVASLDQEGTGHQLLIEEVDG
jgi:hypothetical protein